LQVGNGEFSLDSGDIGSGIGHPCDVNDVLRVEGTHHVAHGVDVANVGEELIAQPFTVAGPFHQAGNVNESDRGRNHFFAGEQFVEHAEARVRDRHHTGIGLDRCERIIGCQHPGVCQRVEQGRLANVRESDDAYGQAHRHKG
jgi:hypothetical protein